MDKRKIICSSEKGTLTFLKGNADAFISGLTSYEAVPDKISIKDVLYLEGAFVASLNFARGGTS